MPNNTWLKLSDATFYWQNQLILNSVSLELSSRLTWLIGPSGVGKSTFLRIIAGHFLLQSGDCFVFNEPIRKPSPARAMVLQDFKLFPWLSVFDNVSIGMRFLKYDPDMIQERTIFLL
ncbi:MAG: hypothetical protein OMM_11167, partial [Candidatus Magnetoglobus multicellularis str. Araruama]